MPIFRYFAVVGSVLVTLLFVADANLGKSGPPALSSDFYGLPKPWHPDPAQTLAATPAPAPDMASAEVAAAKAGSAETTAKTAQTDVVVKPEKKKRVAKRHSPQEAPADHFAFRNSDPGPFGGGGLFGRF
jgi:hypothetical protein